MRGRGKSKDYLVTMLREAGHEVIDFGDRQPKLEDDYPDFVVPLARRVASLVWELVGTFLAARFSGAERHRRRLTKVAELEMG